MTLTRSNPKVRWPEKTYPLYILFVEKPSLFANFLYVFKDETLRNGIGYTKTNRKEIIRYPSFSFTRFSKLTRKIAQGGMILIDEYEIKGGCEDDNWV